MVPQEIRNTVKLIMKYVCIWIINKSFLLSLNLEYICETSEILGKNDFRKKIELIVPCDH